MENDDHGVLVIFTSVRSPGNSISCHNYSEAKIKMGFILSLFTKKILFSSIKTHQKATRISVQIAYLFT